MALLSMCMEADIKVAVAHVNYHMREQADREQAYVQAYCQEHGIVCHVLDKPFTYTHNFEAEARDHRYEFFVSLVQEHHYVGIMTAHHRDDLLETYIMQKERNVIPTYYGMQRSSYFHGVKLYRPLLDLTKQDLEAYCQNKGIRYYIDHTNLETVHTRNRIRHEMLSFSQDQKRALYDKIVMENAALAAVRQQAAMFLKDGLLDLKCYRNAPMEVRLTALRMLIDPAGNSHRTKKHLAQVDEVICKQRDFCIGFEERELVQCGDMAYMQVIPHSYRQPLSEGSGNYFIVAKEGRSTERLAYDDREMPLYVRNFQEGDKIVMRYGTKSIHRFFIDRRIPKGMRKSWPIVVNKDDEIVLVPGLGCSADHWQRDHEIFVKYKEDGRLQTNVIPKVK